MASSKGKVIYTLASELINKELEESLDEFESTVEVSNNPESYFSDEVISKVSVLSLLIKIRQFSLPGTLTC